ncbi:MAG: flagellar biosynthetic protein FliR [Nitrospirae bacterium]|nr:MAG: flagellar biosynthetic protein FliR [Nitrospirota bacterium]
MSLFILSRAVVLRFELALSELWSFVFVLVRTAGILLALPIIGTQTVPVRIRVMIAVALALVFAPIVAVPVEPRWFQPASLTVGLSAELLIGLVLGLATRLLLAAVELAGSIMGLQLGFGVAVQLDPVSQVETPVLGSFLVILASLLYFVVDGHHLVLLALGASFRLIPPFGGTFHPPLLTDTVAVLQEMFVLGMKLAIPVVVVTFLVYVLLGILGRVMPQMNVLFTGFPLTIGIGLTVIGFGLPLFALLFQQTVLGLEEVLVGLVEEMGRG